MIFLALNAFPNRLVTAWMRYTGLQQTGALRGFPITLLTKGDANHLQPFILLNDVGKPLQIAFAVAGTGRVLTLPSKYFSILYWSKFTFTYTTTGSKSKSSFYINQTLISNWTDEGKVMRWSDSTTLVIGTNIITSNTHTQIYIYFQLYTYTYMYVHTL